MGNGVFMPPAPVKNGMLPEDVCFFDVVICNLSRLKGESDC